MMMIRIVTMPIATSFLLVGSPPIYPPVPPLNPRN